MFGKLTLRMYTVLLLFSPVSPLAVSSSAPNASQDPIIIFPASPMHSTAGDV